MPRCARVAFRLAAARARRPQLPRCVRVAFRLRSPPSTPPSIAAPGTITTGVPCCGPLARRPGRRVGETLALEVDGLRPLPHAAILHLTVNPMEG